MLIYPDSIAATIISLISSGFILFGFFGAIRGEVPLPIALITIAIGIAGIIFGGRIRDDEIDKKWLRAVKEKGSDELVRNSVEGAVAVYNSHPSTFALNYIRSINPEAAAMISSDLEEQKKKS